MGAGKSRAVTLNNVIGGTVTFSDGTSESVGSSWEDLISQANEDNNYFNCYYLSELQEDGFYSMDEEMRDRYFDEDSLYLVNQLVNAYKIQERITGGNPEFMYPCLKEDGSPSKFGSRVNIRVDNLLGVEPTEAYASNGRGRITLNTHVKDPDGNVYDLRKPSQAESSYKAGYKVGWGTTDSTVGCILHEYGHSIETVISKKYPTEYATYLKETGNGVHSGFVSGYPATVMAKGNTKVAGRENFAEAYAAYATGTPIRGDKFAKNYYESFKKLMSSVGIKEGTRSNNSQSNIPTRSRGVSAVGQRGAATPRPPRPLETIRDTMGGSAPPPPAPPRTGPSIIRTTGVRRGGSTLGPTPKPTPTPKPPTPAKPKTPTKPTTTKSTGSGRATQFINRQGEVSGAIKGTKFSAKLTPTVLSRGYITRTVGGVKYQIDIKTGSYKQI